MRYEVVIARSAAAAFKTLDGRWRSRLKQEMRAHLEHHPRMESKSAIKRLGGLRQPQYRMRVDEMRVYYDVDDAAHRVEVLGFVKKAESQEWLEQYGTPE